MAEKLVIMLLTPDPDHPHTCGTPFFQAACAAAMDVEVEVYFASRSARLLVKGVAERIYPSENATRSVYGFMRDAAQLGAKFFVCGGAVEGLGASRDDLIPECSGIAGVTAYIGRVMDDEWKSISY